MAAAVQFIKRRLPKTARVETQKRRIAQRIAQRKLQAVALLSATKRMLEACPPFGGLRCGFKRFSDSKTADRASEVALQAQRSPSSMLEPTGASPLEPQ